jgi:hypothetical protein
MGSVTYRNKTTSDVISARVRQSDICSRNHRQAQAVMVVRPMLLKPFMQCSKDLNFSPRRTWPKALPAIAWRGALVCAFDRTGGLAVDHIESDDESLVNLLTACHPELGLSELARLDRRLNPKLATGTRESLFAHYGLRWCDRLEQTLAILMETPVTYQDFADNKSFSVRDHAPLLSLPNPPSFAPFLEALAGLNPSKSESARMLELGVELFLLGRPLGDLLPGNPQDVSYLRRLEQWRQPRALTRDEEWKVSVASWPWPAQVRGQWQRFGDQAGLEIKIRTTSPEDLDRKLRNLLTIGENWSCKM